MVVKCFFFRNYFKGKRNESMGSESIDLTGSSRAPGLRAAPYGYDALGNIATDSTNSTVLL
jgi:hypothetical protein